jgi:Fe-S oxidoreductase
MVAALKGDIKPDKRLLESSFICTTCGWCVEVCPQNNFLGHVGVNAPLHMPSLNTGLRNALLQDDPALMPAGAAYLCENVAKHNSCFKISKEEKTGWAKGLNLPISGSTIFYASCMNTTMGFAEILLRRSESMEGVGLSYERLAGLLTKMQSVGLDGAILKPLSLLNPNKKYTESLRNAAKCLKELSVNCAYMGEAEPCCGAPYHTYGQYQKFKDHARKVYAQLRASGVDEIITLNPICGAILRNYYPQVVPEWNIKVKHFSEAVADKLSTKKLSLGLPKKAKVVFHDPCHLSRHQRVVDAPRKIIQQIDDVELTEPRRCKFNSRCAGCGGLEATHPKIAKKIAEDRARELLETGADYVVTSCPACVMMIRVAAKDMGKDITPIEISDFAWQAMHNEPGKS